MRPESACAKAIVLSLLSLVVLPARASIIHVQINGNGNPAYTPQFGGISFDVNTAATADTATTGSCGGGSVSGVYNTIVATGGVSNGSLVWNGVSQPLQDASFDYYENFDTCSYYLTMNLGFAGGSTFSTVDQPAIGDRLFTDYTPSEVLAQALIGGYDDYEPVGGQATIQTGYLSVGGATAVSGFYSTASTVAEPGGLALFAAGLLGLAWTQRRRIGL